MAQQCFFNSNLQEGILRLYHFQSDYSDWIYERNLNERIISQT